MNEIRPSTCNVSAVAPVADRFAPFWKAHAEVLPGHFASEKTAETKAHKPCCSVSRIA